MTSYIFVGRLDKEKGINILLDAFIKHQESYSGDELHICGIGQYTNKVIEIANTYTNIIYHGRVGKEKVKEYVQSCDYMVMPSTFLETFGLTALESIMLGIPVIGNKKGGCEQFIHPLLHVGTDHKEGINSLSNLFGNIHHGTIDTVSFQERINNIKKSYTEGVWGEKLSHLSLHKNIILLSDYTNKKLGGIETHLNTIQKKLKEMGYITEIWESGGITGIKGKLQRVWDMLLSIYNKEPRSRLHHHIQGKRETTIRFHSILRHIGRYTISQIGKIKKGKTPTDSSIQTMTTYHDLGLFHPFPHRVSQISQLPPAWSLKGRLISAQTKNPIVIIAVVYKYILITLIHKHLRHAIDIHIVPSFFMIEIIQRRHPKSKCIILPHFVDMGT